MLKAEYGTRGPIAHEVIGAVEMTLDPIGPGQARLAVLAAPINPSDVLTLTGEYALLPDLPAIGGNEGVGRVVEIGTAVDTVSVGDLVLLPIGSGTWRSHMNADSTNLVVLPRDVDPKQLAMLAVNPPTASLMLSTFVDLDPGDWVIQNAANSAVGGYLIQLAAERGLRTVNIVRRESAMQGVLESGGDICLVDGKGLRGRVLGATDGAHPRLGIDAVAGEATGRLGSTLANGGTLVTYGAMSDEPCAMPASNLIFSGITHAGFWLARWFGEASRTDQVAVFGAIAAQIAAGRLLAPVAATYPIEEIKAAVEHAAAGERDGKILLVPIGS